MPVGVETHRSIASAAPVDGEEAHRASKLAHARRNKRPVCETELPGRDSSHDANEPTADRAVLAAATDATRRRISLDSDQFEILIIREWTKTLKGPYDWADWPLARYSFKPGFLTALEQHRGLSAAALARACAMVACGRAERMRSIDPRPRLDGSGGRLSREDGASAWCCNVRRDAVAGPQIDYWVLPGGRIEFDAVVTPDKDAHGATADGSSATQDRPWRG